VDGRDQVECWGSFRVARRAAPYAVSFVDEEGRCRFEGRFGGYGLLLGDRIEHHRRIDLDRPRRSITVTDTIEGEGRHRVESRIHLHPAVTVEEEDSRLVLRRDGLTGVLTVLQGGLTWETGWYCPRFGVRLANRVAVLGGPAPLPATLSYTAQY
jgi:hypothetical protein